MSLKTLLHPREAKMEAERRFGAGTSRAKDFMAAYNGLNKKYGRAKYRWEYGLGRRSKKIDKFPINSPKIDKNRNLGVKLYIQS